MILMLRLVMSFSFLQVTSAQLFLSSLAAQQCDNLLNSVCRPQQCLDSELSVSTGACGYFSSFLGTPYVRCASSMPCCYWPGAACQTSCNSNQFQLYPTRATCSTAGQVCCIGEVGSVTSAPTTVRSVAERQGVCGQLVMPRLYGAQTAGVGDWPWMVRLLFSTTSGFCAGVLVDADTVVTPAHCVAQIPVASLRVVLGDYNRLAVDAGEETVGITRYYLDSGFVRGIRGRDFAVLKLSKSVTYSARKVPVCLPDPTLPINPSRCYVAGWGISETGLAGNLRSAGVTMLEKTVCEQRLRALNRATTLPRDIICTENYPTSPVNGCLYDDGDMLVCQDSQGRWSLVGLLSEYSCTGTLPPLFTDIRIYTEVILSQL